jgi:hypothetical protein
MEEEYTFEQLEEIFQKLPEKLKDKILALETAEEIFDICAKNGIDDLRIPEIARCVGEVLMGLLPPSEFEETLERKVNLEREIALNVAKDIERIIFSSVKNELENLYGIEIATKVTEKTKEVTLPEKEIPPQKPEEKPSPPKTDIYREPIE